MLIIALVLALIGLVALVFAVVTSNELVAWVCVGASVLGVVLLIIDAVRERQQRHSDDDDEDEDEDEDEDGAVAGGDDVDSYVDYPEEAADEGDQDQGATAVGETTKAADTDTSAEPTVSAERRDDGAK
jgi:hypothetical protein